MRDTDWALISPGQKIVRYYYGGQEHEIHAEFADARTFKTWIKKKWVEVGRAQRAKDISIKGCLGYYQISAKH